jgi:hypothetical protein
MLSRQRSTSAEVIGSPGLSITHQKVMQGPEILFAIKIISTSDASPRTSRFDAKLFRHRATCTIDVDEEGAFAQDRRTISESPCCASSMAVSKPTGSAPTTIIPTGVIHSAIAVVIESCDFNQLQRITIR